jgi:dTMP kinase
LQERIPVFVCFEGIDGAGKSTQARMLLQRLRAENVNAELVADPGTTQIGTAIRQILLNSDAPITSAAQMLLFSAARAELAAYIEKRLADNVVVICDRWLLSTLVYQGEINGISEPLIKDIFLATSDLMPDIYFVLDIDPTVASTRMTRPRDRYERQCAENLQRMRSAYLRHATNCPSETIVRILAAEKPAEQTHEEIYSLFCAGAKTASAAFNL